MRIPFRFRNVARYAFEVEKQMKKYKRHLRKKQIRTFLKMDALE